MAVLFTVVWISFFVSQIDACPSGMFGRDCAYSCNCQEEVDCEKGCECATGWDGPTCQRGNKALQRKVQASSEQQWNLGAKAAVDGALHNRFVTRLNTSEPGWVKIKLDSEMYAPTVKVFLNTKSPYNHIGLQVYTSAVGDEFPGKLCYTLTDNNTDVLEVTCLGVALFVRVYLNTINSNNKYIVLDLSEVQVIGCSLGTYGTDCTEFCSCSGRPCHPTTGHCLQEGLESESSSRSQSPVKAGFCGGLIGFGLAVMMYALVWVSKRTRLYRFWTRADAVQHEDYHLLNGLEEDARYVDSNEYEDLRQLESPTEMKSQTSPKALDS
ncbi:platelet endothelial aggregation receptor 1-like [Haliotis asinina]|uniref:platelet endothelial aggregation receptor 1-like n=1 Tax=Haliotis asinina TaxID=109174 RepID=UPI0035325B38